MADPNPPQRARESAAATRPAMLSDLVPGAAVLYTPILDGRKFRGTVRTEPWHLGNGTPVVHLRDMEPAYGEFVGLPGKTVVHAATLPALHVAVEAAHG